jgi:hypothetical protein
MQLFTRLLVVLVLAFDAAKINRVHATRAQRGTEYVPEQRLKRFHQSHRFSLLLLVVVRALDGKQRVSVKQQKQLRRRELFFVSSAARYGVD